MFRPFKNPSRRDFLLTSGTSLAGFSIANAMGIRALAASQVQTPKWPEPGQSPDHAAGTPEKLPPMHAPTEQNREGKSQPLPPDQRIGFAIVGLGRLSIEELLPALMTTKMARLTAVVSGDQEKARRIAKQYGVPASGIYSYESFDKIKDNKDVQVVYIVLPNSMHKEYTIRAARAGKHVLCEKPMAMNANECEEMIAACKKANVKLMIAYRQQYEPNNRWVQKLVREKTFGKPKLFEASNSQMADGQKGGKQQWRHIKALAGGGALPDIGLYCLNAARFLTGEEPYEVTALDYSTPNDPRFKEIEETIAWMMRFPSGLVGICSSSYGCHETKRYRFTAETGWFGMEPAFAYRGLKTEVSWALSGKMEHHDTPTLPEQNQFALEIEHMADCVRSHKAPRTPGEEGWQDHRIMDAIYESVRTKKPVQLERIEALDKFRNNSLA